MPGGIPQTVKVIINKESLKNCLLGTESSKETCQLLNMMWYPGWNSQTGKGY